MKRIGRLMSRWEIKGSCNKAKQEEKLCGLYLYALNFVFLCVLVNVFKSCLVK